MKVREEQIVNSELAQKSLAQIDFKDTFSTTNHKDSLSEITKIIFGTRPKWVQFLFIIRQFLVKCIGLKPLPRQEPIAGVQTGSTIGFFTVYTIENQEIILGADDSHLNFRAVITDTREPQYNIKVTTLVQYHNNKGRYYMALIKPFHRLVVKNMVRQAYKANP